MKETYTVWARDEDRDGVVINDFINKEGLRRGMMNDYNRLGEEEKQSYINQATEQINGGYNLIMPNKRDFQSEEEKQSLINSQAALLYNIDEYAPKIQPSTLFSSVAYKATKAKEDKRMDITEVEPKSVSLFGKDYNIIDFQKATGAKKMVKILLPSSATERKYKEQREEEYQKRVSRTIGDSWRKPKMETATKKINIISHGKSEGAGKYGEYEILGYDPSIDKILLTKYMTEKDKAKIRAEEEGAFEGISYEKYNMANIIEVPRKDFNMGLLKDILNIDDFSKIIGKQSAPNVEDLRKKYNY